VNGELSRMWKEAVVAYFKVLSQNLAGRTEAVTKNVNQGTWSPGRESDSGPPQQVTEGISVKRDVQTLVAYHALCIFLFFFSFFWSRS